METLGVKSIHWIWRMYEERSAGTFTTKSNVVEGAGRTGVCQWLVSLFMETMSVSGLQSPPKQ